MKLTKEQFCNSFKQALKEGMQALEVIWGYRFTAAFVTVYVAAVVLLEFWNFQLARYLWSCVNSTDSLLIFLVMLYWGLSSLVILLLALYMSFGIEESLNEEI